MSKSPRQPARPASRSRVVVLLIALVAALSIQACTIEDFLHLLMAAKIQEDFRANEYSLVWNQVVTKDFELDCATSSVNVSVSPAGGRPLPNEIRSAYSFIDWETQQRTDTILLLRRDAGQNNYFGMRDDRTGQPAGACPQRLFTRNDQIGLFLNPTATILEGSLVKIFVAVRPIEILQKCKEQVIATSKVVNQAQWIRRPGKSTAIPTANKATMGVRVHCFDTTNGEQGTLRVTFTDKTKEIIGIECRG